MQFLRGLNDQYINVRFGILRICLFPSINKVFSHITQKERQVIGIINTNDLSLVNVVNVSYSINLCIYCVKDEYIVEKGMVIQTIYY